MTAAPLPATAPSAGLWVGRYLGEPWVPGVSDCWSLARRVWAEVWGRITGAWTRSGTTLTVTETGHRRTSGQTVRITAAGEPVRTVQIGTVPDEDRWTATVSGWTGTSGSAEILSIVGALTGGWVLLGEPRRSDKTRTPQRQAAGFAVKHCRSCCQATHGTPVAAAPATCLFFSSADSELLLRCTRKGASDP